MASEKTRSDKDESRRRIIMAAADTIRERELTDWTVENVASHAGCAKGLVLYHFGSKQALLSQVAAEVANSRWSARVTTLRLPPAKAIDQLWEDLSKEVTSGAFRLWLGLMASSATTTGASSNTSQRQQLATAVATTFRLPAKDPALTALPAVLDAFQLLLLQGLPEVEVREAFDSYWLGVLERAA